MLCPESRRLTVAYALYCMYPRVLPDLSVRLSHAVNMSKCRMSYASSPPQHGRLALLSNYSFRAESEQYQTNLSSRNVRLLSVRELLAQVLFGKRIDIPTGFSFP